MDTQRAVGADEGNDLQRRAASWLAEHGVGPGERIAVVAPDSVSYLAVVLGALRSGVIPLTPNRNLLGHELAYILSDADPSLVLGHDDLVDATSHPRRASLAPYPLGRPMAYTSGTTGRPKGVYSGVLSDTDAERLWGEEMDVWSISSDDVAAQIGPLHHSAPLRFAACTWLAGGSVVVPGNFDGEATLDALVRAGATIAFAAPVHLDRLFSADPTRRWSSMRLVAHAGAPCPRRIREEAEQRFGDDAVWEFYGSTEGQFTVCSPADRRVAPTSVGRARPHRRLSVDEDGRIWCRAPRWAEFVYWQDPERTAEAWRERDGQREFTVGDLGRLDGEYLHLDGRRDDLIISGGVNVYPLEVELALAEHPDVADVAVFAVPDDRWGQAVHAAVVPRGGTTAESLDRSVTEWATERLAGYKRPKRVVTVEAIPVGSTGKVRRTDLANALGLGG